MGTQKDQIPRLTLLFRYFVLAVMTIVLAGTLVFRGWSIYHFPNYIELQGGLGVNFMLTPENDGLLGGNIGELRMIRENGGLTVAAEFDSTGAAARADIKPGDLIVAINGVRLKDTPQAFYRAFAGADSAEQIGVEFIRDKVNYHRSLVLKRINLMDSFELNITAGRITGGFTGRNALLISTAPYLILCLLLLLVGAVIGWIRLKDLIAFQISILFFAMSLTVFSQPLPSLPVLPTWVLIVLYCAPVLAYGLVAPLVVRILSVFPNRTRLGRIFLRFQWIVITFFALNSLIPTIDSISTFFGWSKNWLQGNLVLSFFETQPFMSRLFLFTAVPAIALLIAQRIQTRGKPHSRLKVIEMGIAIGFAGLLFLTLVALFLQIVNVPKGWERIIVISFFLLIPVVISAMPFSFAYSVLAHKVFGIRFILRKGLQHLLLSKGALLLEGVIIFLIVLQVIRHGGTRLASSMTAVSGIAVGSSLLVLAGLSRINRKLMPVIDRRFFRETLDVRHLLLELGDQLSELREREKILKRTASTVLKALHPLRVVLLLKEAQTKDIKCALDLKNGTSRLASIEDLEKEAVSIPSLELKSEDSAIQQLEKGKSWLAVYPEKLDPENEQERRLLELNCELLIALQGSSGLIGLMGLGAKLSEEPFSGEDRELLLTVARQMGMALENAELLEVAKREAEFSRELEIARQVQQNLFPKKLPTPSGWEFAGFCRPAKAVGGDYYDIFEVAPGKVVFALGDVSGKGLGPSFLMSSVHATIRTQAITSLDDPVKLITELNRYLLSSSSPETFITLFFGLLDLNTGELRYINCGHPAGILMRPDEKKHEGLDEGGPILGILDGVPYKEGVCRLNTGDFLVLFSDGVTEATNQKEEMFEEERLLEILSTVSGLEASEVLKSVLRSVDTFTAECEQADDISIIVVRCL